MEPWDERSHVRPLPTDFACSDAKCGKPQMQSQIDCLGWILVPYDLEVGWFIVQASDNILPRG